MLTNNCYAILNTIALTHNLVVRVKVSANDWIHYIYLQVHVYEKQSLFLLKTNALTSNNVPSNRSTFPLTVNTWYIHHAKLDSMLISLEYSHITYYKQHVQCDQDEWKTAKYIKVKFVGVNSLWKLGTEIFREPFRQQTSMTRCVHCMHLIDSYNKL